MTDKNTKRRLPRAITVYDYNAAMQQSDNLAGTDTIDELQAQLLLKVAQEARRT